MLDFSRMIAFVENGVKKIKLPKLCVIGIHKFSKWEIVDEGDRINNISKAPIGRYIEQKKECPKCGIVKLRIELS